MNAREESRDAAVSPVIGVMLMLVVTIIIAAVVSSFAGGLGTTKDATPTVTFKADLSVADGLTITCLRQPRQERGFRCLCRRHQLL